MLLPRAALLFVLLAACVAAQDEGAISPPARDPAQDEEPAPAPMREPVQEPPARPTEPAPAAAATAPVSDPSEREGLAALEAAARFQRGETPRSVPASLHGRFHVTAKDDHGNQVVAEVERWYTREPERLLTSRKEVLTGIGTTVGWDDGRAWFRDDRKGTVKSFSDDPALYQADLEILDEQLRLTRLLLDAAVLDALRPRLANVRVGGHDRVTDLDGEVHDVLLVDATAPDEVFGPAPDAPPSPPGTPLPRLELRLGIGTKDGALWSLRVRAPHRPDLAVMQLVFPLHGATRGGLRVPAHIKVFREGETQEQLKLGVEEDEQGLLLFDVDEPVAPELFAQPPSR